VSLGVGRSLLPLLRLTDAPPAPPIGAHRVLTVERAAPSYLSYLRLHWALRFAAAAASAIAIMSVMRGFHSLWALLELLGLFFVVGGAAFNFLVIRLDYELRWYVITDRSLLIREGIWNQREITLTFANVQNVTVTQGPLERIFGISDVVVSTAGGSTTPEPGNPSAVTGHNGRLRGVKDPHRLRDQILRLLQQQKGAGLGDLPDARPTSHASSAKAWRPAQLTVLREAADAARSLRLHLGDVAGSDDDDENTATA
jgi:membrane protein YdbS with pleckstrin-like domain